MGWLGGAWASGFCQTVSQSVSESWTTLELLLSDLDQRARRCKCVTTSFPSLPLLCVCRFVQVRPIRYTGAVSTGDDDGYCSHEWIVENCPAHYTTADGECRVGKVLPVTLTAHECNATVP